ncbi:MAG: hypothetical protein AWL62_1283, partial [Halanaerobium sp. T82-1]
IENKEKITKEAKSLADTVNKKRGLN